MSSGLSLSRLPSGQKASETGQNLGYREIEIIKSATPEDFSFVCFYDAGNGWYRNYIPIYNVAGMEYFVSGGKINVIG